MTGIIEVNLDRPVAKNAINKEMLKSLQNAFESIHQDRSARVVMIRSLVPGVFCAGADLKVVLSLSYLPECSLYLLAVLKKFLFFFLNLLGCQERRTMSPSEVHTYVNSLRYMFSFMEVYSLIYHCLFS